jgi:hypothetical protein
MGSKRLYLEQLKESLGITPEFILSRDMSAGDVVQIKPDGTLEKVFETGEQLFPGDEYVFNNGSTSYTSTSFIPNTPNKFVVVYCDTGNSNYGTAVVGTVNGNTITFGDEYVFNNDNTGDMSISFDPNNENKFVVAYQDGTISYRASANVGTISGDTITFGDKTTFSVGTSNYISTSFDPYNANKIVVAYQDGGNSDNAIAKVGTVSGDTITLGDEILFNGTEYITISFDPHNANKIVATYQANTNPYNIKASVGTVSGDTITLGNEYDFNDNSVYTLKTGVAFDPNTPNKFVIVYKDVKNSSYGTAVVGTINGDTITFGKKYIFNSGYTNYITISFDPYNAKKFVVTYTDSSNSSRGTATIGVIPEVLYYTTLNDYQIIGILNDGGKKGEKANATLYGGYYTKFNDLTIGSYYYVHVDGSINTTSTNGIYLGFALTTNMLLIKSAPAP